MELIRYIHLNPLRAKLVEDLKALDKYPWTGHSAILGWRKNPLIPKLEKEVSSADKRIGFSQFHLETEKARMNPENPVNPVRNISLAERTIEDVLKHFGKTLKEARRRYREFVEKGIKHGRRTDLQGGGLVRSAGGDASVLSSNRKEDRPACHARHRRWPNRKTCTQIEERGSKLDKAVKARAGRELSDERILGSGNFVAFVIQDKNELEEKRLEKKIPLDELIRLVSDFLGIEKSEVFSRSRKRIIGKARALIAYYSIYKMPAP